MTDTVEAAECAAKTEGQRSIILDAAEAAFIAQGFHATTMDAIARAAHCSKKTVYKLFASKEELFQALMLRTRLEASALPVDTQAAPELALRGFLQAVAGVILRDKSIALLRIALAGAGESAAELRQTALQRPPEDKLLMEDYLADLSATGAYDFGPPEEASRMLIGMALGAFHHQLLAGLAAEVPEMVLNARIDRSVYIFLKGSRV